MQPQNTDVFFTSTLLRLDQSRRAVHTDNQASRHFRVERAAVARLFYAQDSSDPGDDLMRRWIGGFVQVDNSISGSDLRDIEIRTMGWRWFVAQYGASHLTYSLSSRFNGELPAGIGV